MEEVEDEDDDRDRGGEKKKASVFAVNRVLSQAKKKILTLKIFDKIAAILSKKRSRRCALSRAKRTSATQKVHFY